MKELPINPEMIKIARKLVWFEEPEQSLANPIRFMAYAMTRATATDMAEIRRHISDEEFIEAIDHAPPGIIDPRSWAHWNLVIAGRSPPPPLPAGRFTPCVESRSES